MEGAPLRIALLSYRSLPTCGGQGVYVRHLSRELVALGHRVEVVSGPPYPVLDPGVDLTALPSLDLYRHPDSFRWPAPREFHDIADAVEFGMMRTGQFSEPLAFSIRAYRALRPGGVGPKTRGRSATVPCASPAQPRPDVARVQPGVARIRPDFDIVHDNQGLGYGLLALRRALRPHGIPILTTVHHPITVDRRLHLEATSGARAQFGVRRWYSFLPMQARVARGLDGVTVPSDSSRRQIVTDMTLPFERIHTIPLGVKADVFCPAPVRTPPVPGRIIVVTSADVPLKGLLVLLEALAKIRAERTAHLICIGKVREGGVAERQVAELGLTDAVTFRSGVPEDELVELLRSAEVAVVPSLYEGFSLPAVEEMACGLPLVATTAGALPEVAGPHGEAALLVPPGDAGALASAITTLLNDPELRGRMGAAGRRRVEQRFSWRAAAAATADWYAERIEAVRRGSAGGPGPTGRPGPARRTVLTRQSRSAGTRRAADEPGTAGEPRTCGTPAVGDEPVNVNGQSRTDIVIRPDVAC